MLLRAFLAIVPPPEVQQQLATVREACQHLPGRWRWTRPADLHLTLHFLDTLSDERVAPLVEALAQALQGCIAFPLCLKALGCFPGPARPRILWSGLEDSQQALDSLQQRVATVLLPLGFPLEARPFHPHVTLARAQNARPSRQMLAILQHYSDRCFGAFLATQVHLMHSQTPPGEAHYAIVRSMVLAH